MRAKDSSNPRAHKRSVAAGRHRKSSRGQSRWVLRGMTIAKSHALRFRSNLLLLRVANHSYRRTGAGVDLKLVEFFRSELHNTEAALRKTGQDELAVENGDFWLQMYADLIACATASLNRMRAAMPSHEAADRFETATDVQMLEELIAEWRSRIEVIRQSTTEDAQREV
jgi:hypothetical protein